jgi:hypothetical protein
MASNVITSISVFVNRVRGRPAKWGELALLSFIPSVCIFMHQNCSTSVH